MGRGLSGLLVAASALALSACAATGDGPLPAGAAAPAVSDQLAAGFADPPRSARPRTWWHWLNGNVTKEGIAKDLAWMDRVGLGGFQTFDAGLMTPQIVDKRLVYMTPEWRDAFRFAITEANRLGLEAAIAASPGWSETGGPWVAPEDAMKKLVWSETIARGGRRFSAALRPLPSNDGPYQDAPVFEPLAGHSDGAAPKRRLASGAVAVLAVPIATATVEQPRVTDVNGRAIDGAVLSDGQFARSIPVAVDDRLTGALYVTFPKPVTVHAVQGFLPELKRPFRDVPVIPRIQAWRSGAWHPVADMPVSEVPTTVAFAPVTADRFRLAIIPDPEAGTGGSLDAPAPGAETFDIFALGKLDAIKLAELRFSAEPVLDRVEAKAGFATAPNYHDLADTVPEQPAFAANDVIDLSDRVDGNGRLDWTPPPGRDWRILRFGWSLTGKTNHPATAEATGFEVDKFDPQAVERYLNTYLAMYRETVGDDLMGEAGIRAILTDSIEVGASNWTGRMEQEFAARRGYALRPWLPALTGAVVGSRRDSDRFLSDYRTTLAEMLTDHHYGTVARIARAHGLRVYGEALENGRPILGDDLAMRSHADVPMAAMWTWQRDGQPRWPLVGDMKGASSVAHVYGRSAVAAESMTSANAPWAFAPRDLKRVIDFEFAHGINLPVIHTSVHVPTEGKKPGLSLMIFGQYFNRNDTWAEMARPWIDYIARSSFLLQQGRNVADVAVFHGEESPLTVQFASGVPANLPRNYAYDLVNADMLDRAFRVADGTLRTTGGARYRALYLGGTSAVMTVPTLQRIVALADQGATVIGEPPVASPSLSDDAAAFADAARRLRDHPNFVASRDVDEAMRRIDVAPDVVFKSAEGRADVLTVHRMLDDGHAYFVNNRANRALSGQASFRVTGLIPSLWDARTGRATPLSYRMEQGRTIVPLNLAAEDAIFVVFRGAADTATRDVAEPSAGTAIPVGGPWTVTFPPGAGAPPSITLDRLASLSEHALPGVRYFSGVATYRTTLTLSADQIGRRRLWLDLGTVGDVAEVMVNGRPAGITWFAPDRVEIARLVRPGANLVEIRVANRWVNRLIGDKQPGAEKVTFTAAPTYRADAALFPAGLIGPVVVMAGD